MRLKKRHTDSGRLGFLAGRGAQGLLVALAVAVAARAGVAGRNEGVTKLIDPLSGAIADGKPTYEHKIKKLHQEPRRRELTF